MPVALPVLVALGLGFAVAYLLTRKETPSPAGGPIVLRTEGAAGGGTPTAAPPVAVQRTAGSLPPLSLPNVQIPTKPSEASAALDALAKAFPSLAQGAAQITVEAIRANTATELERMKLRPNDLVTSAQAANPLGSLLKSDAASHEVNVFAASDGRIYALPDAFALRSQAELAQAQALALTQQAYQLASQPAGGGGSPVNDPSPLDNPFGGARASAPGY